MTSPSAYPLPKGERESFTTLSPTGGWGSFYTLSPIGGEGRVRGQVCERLSRYARRLRRSQTDAERKLWSRLRDRRLNGARFRRQHPIGPYIADFCCTEAKLVVELDGGQHAVRKRSDAERTAFLAGQGYRVLRFWDNEALTNMEGVLLRIIEALGVKGPFPSPCPLPKGERVSRTLAPGGGEGR
jgi:very-short-patch-repair endonuclease